MKIKGIDLDIGYKEIHVLPIYDGDSASIARAVNHAVGGLLTDGAHHKQEALEKVIESLGIDLEELRSALQSGGYDWES